MALFISTVMKQCTLRTLLQCSYIESIREKKEESLVEGIEKLSK